MKALVIVAVALLAACDRSPPAPPEYIDQCLRREMFESCLTRAPAGPTVTKYNDWDEVVSECGSQAYYLSIRPRNAIPPACAVKR